MRFCCQILCGFVVLIPLYHRTLQCSAEETVTVEFRKDVTAALENLKSPSRRKQAQAARRLLELGPSALPFFPAPELLADDYTRELFAGLRVKLERQQANASLQATRVSLVRQLTVQTALQRITAQTGNNFDLSELRPEQLALKLPFAVERQPFWATMDQLCDLINAEYPQQTPPHTLKLSPRTPKTASPLAVTYNGPFRIAVLSAEATKLMNSDGARLIRCRLLVSAEPRLRPLFLRYQGTSLTANIDTLKLQPFSPNAKMELPLGEGGVHAPILFAFLTSKQTPENVMSLQGNVHLQTAAGAEEITFTDLGTARNVARRRGGVTVTLNQVQTRQDEQSHRASVQVTVTYDRGGPAFESHRTWIFHNEVALIHPDGSRVELNDGYETVLQADGGVGVIYRFKNLPQNPARYKFIYVAPTLILDVPVKFNFPQVPILFPE